MDKPTGIKDAKALAYIEFLENQIEEFKNHTKKKFYRGIQRQLDLLAEEMLSDGFEVSLKPKYTWEGEKRVKEDSGFDSFFDMMTRGEAITKAMEKFESQAFPNVKEVNKKNIVKEEGVEEFLKNKD